MKRSDWIIWVIGAALLTLVLIATTGCRTTSSTDNQLAAQSAASLDTQASTDKHETRGLVESSERKLKFRPPAYRGEPLKDRLAEVDGEKKKAGPVDINTAGKLKTQGKQETAVTWRQRLKSTYDFLHSNLALLGGLVLLAVVLYIVYRVLKPKVPIL